MPNSTATPDTGQSADQRIADLQAQVAQLQEQVARLRAERSRLCWAVGHDELTGLPNRRLFHTLAPRLLNDSAAARPAAVLVLDLNGFKPINDQWGHHTGDHVLRTAAHRLATVAAGHLVARLGGDEFAAVLTYPFPTSRPTWWRPTINALCTALAEPIPVNGRTLTIHAAIGVAKADPDTPVDELLHRADQAMYLAKRGRTTPAIGVWQPTDHQPAGGHPTGAGDNAGEDTRQRPAYPTEPATPPPTLHPSQRDPAHVAPASTYHPSDPVWVFRDGAWRTAVVNHASRFAVTATYRRSHHHGTGVDTMTAQYVLPRGDTDSHPDLRLTLVAS